MIQARQNGDNVRRWICILLWQDGRKEGRQCLCAYSQYSRSFSSAKSLRRTSSACEVAGPPCLRQATDRAKSRLVCPCRLMRSSGLNCPNMRCREARSGFRRKNSRQKPSVFSPSPSNSSSSWGFGGSSAIWTLLVQSRHARRAWKRTLSKNAEVSFSSSLVL